jgi:hypothetical protein
MANTVQNARDAAGHAADKAKDLASTAMDRTREAASSVADKTKDLASRAGQKADDMAGRAGSALESAASSVRDHAPGGVLGTAANKVAGALESSGRYLREEGMTGMAEDLTDLIRRNPIPAMLLGFGLGFLLARALSSNN